MNHRADSRDFCRIMQITMEEWNEIQHIGCDSNEHDWLLDLLSENNTMKVLIGSSQCWNLK